MKLAQSSTSSVSAQMKCGENVFFLLTIASISCTIIQSHKSIIAVNESSYNVKIDIAGLWS